MQIGSLIGTLRAEHVDVDSDQVLELTGKPRLDGIMKAIGEVSNLKNSGGRNSLNWKLMSRHLKSSYWRLN